jgi:hypothetical protein
MDTVALYRSMATRWQDASREVTNTALGACYARRAEEYLKLAAQESNRTLGREPQIKDR